MSGNSFFCLLSNQADYHKTIGGGYRNTFCLIETVGLLENGSYGEGEWSGVMEEKMNVYFEALF